MCGACRAAARCTLCPLRQCVNVPSSPRLFLTRTVRPAVQSPGSERVPSSITVPVVHCRLIARVVKGFLEAGRAVLAVWLALEGCLQSVTLALRRIPHRGRAGGRCRHSSPRREASRSCAVGDGTAAGRGSLLIRATWNVVRRPVARAKQQLGGPARAAEGTDPTQQRPTAEMSGCVEEVTNTCYLRVLPCTLNLYLQQANVERTPSDERRVTGGRTTEASCCAVLDTESCFCRSHTPYRGSLCS